MMGLNGAPVSSDGRISMGKKGLVMAFEITLERMIIFFLILCVGFAAGKLSIITRDYLPQLAKLITKVFLPVLLFWSTFHGTTWQMVADNALVIVFSVVFYASITAVTFLIAKVMRIRPDRDWVFMLCFVFGNTGFVGMPLLSALFPDTGLLYLALFSIVDQAVFWTFGVWLATARDRKARFSPRSFLTPNIVALALALACIVLQVRFPQVICDTLATISSATSALCMMYLGAMLCFSKWSLALRCPELYVGIAVKMVLLPVVGGHIMQAIGLPQEFCIAMVVIMSLPIMTVVPMIAKQNGHEGDYAAGMTVVTLIASVVTTPCSAACVPVSVACFFPRAVIPPSMNASMVS